MSDQVPERRSTAQPPAVDALPGLIRLAATSWVRTAEWSVGASLHGTKALLRAAASPANAMQYVAGVAKASAVVADVVRAVSIGVPVPQAVAEVGAALNGVRQNGAARSGQHGDEPDPGLTREQAAAESLRQQGEALLMRSRDVWNNEQGHPAYARILQDLAPDEGRILLLFLRDGPQPAVDVRTGGAVGVVSSRLLKSGMTMIGPRAGVRYLDNVPSYLHNLFRLGLIWFSREQLSDPLRYQVLEAQPDVLEVTHSVKHAKIVRRSLHLTPFGEDFCKAVLVRANEHFDLPEHDSPLDQG